MCKNDMTMLRTAGQQVTVLLVGSKPDVGHVDTSTLELPTHAGIDTLRSSP